ncbi:hypothetical protein ACQUJO_20170 [Ralstonia pseudosolanacearum]
MVGPLHPANEIFLDLIDRGRIVAPTDSTQARPAATRACIERHGAPPAGGHLGQMALQQITEGVCPGLGAVGMDAPRHLQLDDGGPSARECL